MKAILKTVLGFFTGGTSAWLPYVIVAGLVAAGTGFGIWKLIVAPRLEAADLRVAAAEKQLKDIADANAETERSLRLQQAQADYDRKATAQKLADIQAMAEHAAAIKKDISHVQGAQDTVSPIVEYGNSRLRELRAARGHQDGNAVSVSP